MEIPKGCLDIYLLHTNCVYKQQSMIRPIKINADHIFHAQNVCKKKMEICFQMFLKNQHLMII